MKRPRFLTWASRAPRISSGSSRKGRPRRLEAEPLESRALLTLTFGNTFGFGASTNGAVSVSATGFALDSQGDRFVSGSFYGTVNFGGTSLTSNGFQDGFLAKYSPTGTLIYAKSVGGTLNDNVSAVAVDAAGDAYATGFYAGVNTDFGNGHVLNAPIGNAAFVWKLDPSGNTLLAVSTTSPSSASIQPQAIAVSPSGSQIAIGGFFSQQVNFGSTMFTAGAGNFDGFVSKLDGNGNFLWASQLKATASGASALVTAVALDANNNVDATGQYTGTVDFDPGAAVNNHTSTTGAIDPFFLNLTGAAGALGGVSTASGAGYNIATGLVTDATGNMYAVGTYQQTLSFTINGASSALTAPASSTGFYLLKLNSSAQGTILRSLNVFDTPPFTSAYGVPSIAMEPNGNLVVGATYNGTVTTSYGMAFPSAGQTDVILATYDATGNELLATTAGGTGADSLSAVAVNSNGVIGLMGSYGAAASFGGTSLSLVAPGGSNVFVSTITQGTTVAGDFLGQGYTQAVLYHESTADWTISSQAGTLTDLGSFGWAGHDLPAPGDYAGTGVAAQAVYRPTTGQWFVKTATGTVTLNAFGWAGHDVAVPGDYDGIGRTEQAVYRPSTAQWFVNSPSGSRLLTTFGWIGHDIPVPADYLGLGYAQPAVYRPSTGQWFVQNPDGTTLTLGTFGWTGHDIPVPGDYTKAGHATMAVYRPSTSQFFVNGTTGAFATFGTATPVGTTPLVDFPAMADTGSLNGLPTFGAGGIIAMSLPASGSVSAMSLPSSGSVQPSVTVAQALPPSIVSPAQVLLRQPLTALFAKGRG